MRAIVFIGLVVFYLPHATAQVINLECNKMAEEIVKRMDKQGLLVPFQESSERAVGIAKKLCEDRQKTALQQHEADKQNFIKNWLTENTGGKQGNERLRRIKR